jgi:hypothetical protein
MSEPESLAALPDRRMQDWPLRLEALVAARMDAPFEWGVRDCCLWAADVVQAVTGYDPAADLRGTYSTAEETPAVIRSIGGISGICADRLGPEVSPALAQVGDVGLFMEDGHPALAAYTGGTWMAQGQAGVVPLAEGVVTTVWRCIACPQP